MRELSLFSGIGGGIYGSLILGNTLMICGYIMNPNWRIWMPNDACANCEIWVTTSVSFIGKVSL